MIKKLLIVALLLVMAWPAYSLIVVPNYELVTKGTGFYSPPLHLLYCKNPGACRHEVGHLMDTDLGDVSKSQEFSHAVALYLVYQIQFGQMDRFTNTMFNTPGFIFYSDLYEPNHAEAGSSPHKELYANLYEEVNGKITDLPPLLQPFYSQDSKYEDIYQKSIVSGFYIH